jgi:hypothetical protein
VALGSRCRKSLQKGAGKVLNARVECHPVVQFRVERNLIFQVSLEIGPVHLNSGRSGGRRKDERNVVSMSTGRWSELSAENEVGYTGEV